MTNKKPLDLAAWIMLMLDASASDWMRANQDFVLRKEIVDAANALAKDAYHPGKQEPLEALHRALGQIYNHDFSTAQLARVDCESQPILREIAAIFEQAMLDAEMSAIGEASIGGYPLEGEGYVKWLKKLISQHTSSVHSLYNDYLAFHATSDDLAYYLTQETNLDPRFDDILALMQIGTPVGQKLEIAKNYFDEMGNGEEARVHSHLFSSALNALNITDDFIASNMLIQARVSGNISACLALYRRHYFKAVGYFGVTEYLAPRRFKYVVEAWRRNELPEAGIVYHNEHIVIDTQHAKSWFNNVVVPLINENPAIGREIAIGAAIRLNSSERYLDALLARLENSRAAVAA
jgi:uncharacterized protein YqcC (DUF446 family)